MKIVMTVERYWPAVGGAERVVQRVAEGLVSHGHDVSVLTSGPRRSEQIGGVVVERFPISGNLAKGIAGNIAPVLEFVRQSRPDVVLNYAAQTWTTDACSSFLREPRPFALVLAPCGFSALDDASYKMYFAKLRRELPHYDALIFHSASYRDFHFAADAGVAPDRCRVIQNAADEPNESRQGDRQLTLTTVGSHVRSKGHDAFIRLARRLAGTRPLNAIVVAPRRRGLSALRGCQPRCIAESVRPRTPIKFQDGTRPGVVASALASTDIFVLPSQIECAPLVILESMAAGIPWVSYDVGNVRDLTGGIVVDDFASLVATTRQLMQQPKMRDELGAAGHEAWTARHQWPTVVGLYETLFEELVTARDSGAAQPSSRVMRA